MTIKNMVEFAQAEADGADFGRMNPEQNHVWWNFDTGAYSWAFIKSLIEAGELRIKPKAVTLYKYTKEDDEIWSHNYFEIGLMLHGNRYKYTGISVQNAPIVEGE